MSDKEKELPQEESFEDIFSSLREKYNLEPFGSDEKPAQEEEKVFYNPQEDSEIDDFFKSREEDYVALYEEVDAKMAGVDDEALQKEAEVFNLEFKKEEKKEETEEQQEYEDIYSQSDKEMEYEDIYSNSSDAAVEEEDTSVEEVLPVKEETDPPAIAIIPSESENKTVEETSAPSEEHKEEQLPVVAENEAEEEEKPKKKKSSTGEIIRKIIFVISIIALIGSVAWLVNDYFIQPYLISKENKEIAEMIDSGNARPEEVIKKLDSLDEEEKTITFASLKEANPDFKAWIVVPGADISLPVVKTSNNSKYLRKNFSGKYSVGGTVFIDCNNSSPFNDRNTIIYGHHMRDGSMFGSIKKYKNVNTFKANPNVYVYTENNSYVYKIFSVFLTDANPSADGYIFNYTFKNLSSEENFAAFMEEIRLRSYINTGVDYQEGDRIITLSTCEKDVVKNGRLVLVARLVREDEDEAVDTSAAKSNSNQKFPDAWYARKKQSNPYKNAIRWYAQ